MLIRKCDRCGVLVEIKHEKTFMEKVNELFNPEEADYSLHIADSAIKLDLCDKCQASLKIWFKENK